MDFASQMVMFARVVEAGSISAAARSFGQSPSAVSRQVSALEDRVGLRLLNRSASGISLTFEGELFHERCADIARQTDEAQALLSSLGDHPTGNLRVVSTVAFGKAQILPQLPAFLAAFPEVEVSVDFNDRKLDLAEDRVDVGIQFTEQIEDQNLVARKIAHNRRVICASPDYLQRHGRPKRIDELASHNCLRLSTVERFNDWWTEPPDGIAPMLRGNFEANSADGVYHAALAGIGIARLSTYLVSRDIAEGRLVRLLPDYDDHASDIYAVYSARRNLAPKVRAFIDHLVAAFGPVPPWEMEDEERRLVSA